MGNIVSWFNRGIESVEKTVYGINPDATAYIVAYDIDGKKTKPFIPGLLGDALATNIPNVNYDTLKYLEVWQKSANNVHSIQLNGKMYTVPLPNWTKTTVYLNATLPQDDRDERYEQRKNNLKENLVTYELEEKDKQLPLMLKHVPYVETFSLGGSLKLGAQQFAINNGLDFIPDSGEWESITELKDIFNSRDPKFFYEKLTPPGSFDRYSSDEEFGRQRIAGTNNIWIQKCTDVLLNKINVTAKTLDELFLNYLKQESTFQDAMRADKIFIVDHSILAGCQGNNKLKTCAPIALLYSRTDGELVPIAIQLECDPNIDNPVFLPSDSKGTWIIAKMWFNNADAAIHEGITHLGFTHFIMEGIAAITHQDLALSHPIFKLLAPHFLNIHAINELALTKLAKPNGILDQIMNIGSQGIYKLIELYRDKWRMEIEGTVTKDIAVRGVKYLPGYHFRDDATLIYDAIKKYVVEYLELYYTKDGTISGDYELQKWREKMVATRDRGGLNIQGVPGDKDKFNTIDEIAVVLACIIYTCSAGHAAANFKQYDEYCFPPNYPLLLHGSPPKNKEPVSDGYLEKVIVSMLADKKTTKATISIVKILSTKATQPLGDFEVNYIHDIKAQKVCKQFQVELLGISNTIRDRNITLTQSGKEPYTYLIPTEIPNSISI